MPRRCAIRGCHSHMACSTYISTFKFPDCEETKKLWIAATGRPNWNPTKYSGICSSHFKKEDFTYYMVDKDSRRLRLKNGAVPTIFTTVTPQIRFEPLTVRAESTVSPGDYIGNFEIFTNQYREKLDLSNYLAYENPEMVVFYKLQPSKDVGCNISTRICITNHMFVKVIIENTEIFSADVQMLPRNMKISKWSQIAMILTKYRNESSEFVETREHLLNRALHYLEKVRQVDEDFAHFGKLDIIINQVDLLNKTRPRYEPETILMAFLIHFHSVDAYNILKKFIMLPHTSYLKHISSQTQLPTDSSTVKNDDQSTTNTKATKATDKENYVALVVDEILVKCGYTEIKTEDGGTTSMKSVDLIMMYTIKSIFGNFKKIIRLIPVSCSTEATLFDLTKTVIQFVQTQGFKVLVIITDNTEINRKVFEKYCPTNDFFTNPDFPELKIFYQYDSVRLFKSIRENWMGLENPNKTFTYPDIDDFALKSAGFPFFNVLLCMCKSGFPNGLKKPYKLNATTIKPNSSERHNISLAENIFHDSTIAAMCQFNDMAETANFCGIIRRWWNIVNTKETPKCIYQINCTPDENVQFLEKFLIWLDVWNSSSDSTGRLPKETLEGLIHNTKTFLHVIKFSFSYLKINSIELRKLRSDDFESRFNLNRP